MFQRRKPPKLTIGDELRQTYTDCCNLSIKNLTLEEQNKVEDALKGWKSLHTSLLYKLELFSRNLTKMDEEEVEIFNELRSIRDQNVKHLIRVQLRMDELARRKEKPPTVFGLSNKSTSPNNSVTSKSNMSVPSLRSNGIRSFSNGGKKKMMHSLRPQLQQLQSIPNPKGQKQANLAANVSWQKPKPVENKEESIFDDFDQDLEVDWVPIDESDNKSNNSDVDSDYNLDYYENDADNYAETRKQRPTDTEVPNLIDLDTDYFQISKSLQNLNGSGKNDSRQSSLESNSALQSPNSLTSPFGLQERIQSTNTEKFTNQLQPNQEKFQSISTPDIRINSGEGPVQTGQTSKNGQASKNGQVSQNGQASTTTPKKYIYTKPQPLNIKHLMKKSSSSIPKSKQSAPSASKQGNSVKKSNIQYNYVPVKKNKSPNSLLTSPNKPLKVKQKVPLTSPPTTSISAPDSDPDLEPDLDMTDLLNPKVQDKIISEIRGIDELSAKQIFNDIIDHGDKVYWDDIVGLDQAKGSLKEAVVYPFLRPDLFKGLREPTRGMLLFGPPGTGKTMLARAVATESKSIFFSITSSSITSKYLGESEKLVRALFLLAKKLSPSIVFIDEIDSLLGSRTEGEIESIRRIKNEFLIQWSELSSSTTKENEADELKHQVLILGATNLPWSIDEAARRRFVKRQYIPLPEEETRLNQIKRLLKFQNHTLSDDDLQQIIKLTDNFSGSDITALCKDSAMGPLRSLGELLLSTPTEEIRPINIEDFKTSLKFIKPSVLAESLVKYEDWAIKFGSLGV